MPETRLQNTRSVYASQEQSTASVDGGSGARRDVPSSPSDSQEHDQAADARLRVDQGEGATEARLEDQSTGIAIRFVKQYDVEADLGPGVKCSRKCRSGPYVCDRLAGHPGAHRGYDAIVDEPVFWIES